MIALPLQLIDSSRETPQFGQIPTMYVADANGNPLQTFANGDEIDSAQDYLQWLIDTFNTAALGPVDFIRTPNDISGLGDLCAYLATQPVWRTVESNSSPPVAVAWKNTQTGEIYKRSEYRKLIKRLKSAEAVTSAEAGQA